MKRIYSLDIFRGLTILAMILVNDLEHVPGVPGWLKHRPEDVSGMTFVDVIIPAFLFIVGMALPFAFKQRLDKGATVFQLVKHIFSRSFSLIVMGLLMVNMYTLDAPATGMNKDLWTGLMFLGLILVWNNYPRSEGKKRRFYLILRSLGLLLLLYTTVIYRQYENGVLSWMVTRWWGILGLIGWAYFFTGLAYLLFRRHLAGMMGVLGLLVALYFGDQSGALNNVPLFGFIKKYLWLGGHIGGHGAIVTAGVIVGMLFQDDSPLPGVKARISGVLVFALGLFIAGFLLKPFYGIHKVQATPTWGLYGAAISCLVYLLLYWLVDLKQEPAWTKYIKIAGQNAILAYILPDLVNALLGLVNLFTPLHSELSSVFLIITRSLIYTFLVATLVIFLDQKHIRLKV